MSIAFLRGYRHVLFGLRLDGGKVGLKHNVDAPGSDPRVHQERSALSVSRGRVYVPFGGLTGDCGDYKGRVVSVKTRGKARKRVFTVGVHREGGIWAPSGAAVDGSGNLFVATGNGDATSGFDYGNSVIRLSPQLRQTDFYRASNSPQLNTSDTDLGSVGPTLLGGDRMFVIGKEGLGLILSTAHLGGTGGQLFRPMSAVRRFGGLAYQSPLVYAPCTDGLYALRVSGNCFSHRLALRLLGRTRRSSPAESSGRSTPVGRSTATRRTPAARSRARAGLGHPLRDARRRAAGGCSRRRDAGHRVRRYLTWTRESASCAGRGGRRTPGSALPLWWVPLGDDVDAAGIVLPIEVRYSMLKRKFRCLPAPAAARGRKP